MIISRFEERGEEVRHQTTRAQAAVFRRDVHNGPGFLEVLHAQDVLGRLASQKHHEIADCGLRIADCCELRSERGDGGDPDSARHEDHRRDAI